MFEIRFGVRRYTIMLVSLLMTGCAAGPQSRPKATMQLGPYTEASASALAFDPPMAGHAPHPELARGPRANAAFYGYQEQSTEFYVTASEDLQSDYGDSYQRDSVSVRSGVHYR